jgi:hypothetical protein
MNCWDLDQVSFRLRKSREIWILLSGTYNIVVQVDVGIILVTHEDSLWKPDSIYIHQYEVLAGSFYSVLGTGLIIKQGGI